MAAWRGRVTNPASNVTLQINVSAGDLAYCQQTVPALIELHRSDVEEIVIVADCCRPQASPYFHRETRFPPADFAKRIELVRETCAAWMAAGVCDRVEYLEPDAGRIRSLNARYC